MTYPMLFSDHQHSSRTGAIAGAVGQVARFVPLASPRGTHPKVLLTDGKVWYVQYPDLLVQLHPDGAIAWSEQINTQMASMLADGLVYHSNGPNIYRLDRSGEQQGPSLFAPYCGPRAQILGLFPLADGRHLVQTFERDEEPMPGDRVEDLWSLSLLDSSGSDLWSLEFAERHVPALMTPDAAAIIMAQADGSIRILEPLSGKAITTFGLQDRGIRRISLDRAGNLLVFANTPAGKPVLLKSSSDGVIQWEFPLPAAEVRTFLQPPAVGHDDRVMVVHADTAYCLDSSGNLLWSQGLMHDPDYGFLTILGDDAVVATAANMIRLFDKDGHLTFSLFLEADARICTPAVVDDAGQVVVATSKGVYWIK